MNNNQKRLMAQAQRNAKMKSAVDKKRFQNQGLRQPNSPQALSSNLKSSLPSHLQPGNVGNINNVIWPFWFTFTAPELGPGTASTGTITISQEAAFVWMSYTKSVYRRNATPAAGQAPYTYIDPNTPGAGGFANGLAFTLRDVSSSRQFHSAPLPVDEVGHPNAPSVLPTPILFLPASTLEIFYSNASTDTTYVPFITMFGYRVRVEDAQHILSTVTG